MHKKLYIKHQKMVIKLELKAGISCKYEKTIYL